MKVFEEDRFSARVEVLGLVVTSCFCARVDNSPLPCRSRDWKASYFWKASYLAVELSARCGGKLTKRDGWFTERVGDPGRYPGDAALGPQWFVTNGGISIQQALLRARAPSSGSLKGLS